MNKLVPILLFLSNLVFSSCFDKKHEKAEIRRVWTTYRTAFSNNMGEECSKYIDSESVKYYGHLLNLVKTADSTTVDQLRMDQKLAVLLARHTMPPAQIATLSGTGLFINLVNQGEGGGLSDVPRLEFLSVTPTHAEAQTVDAKGKRGIMVVFNYENEVWKINLAYISGQLRKSGWEQIILESGKTEHEFVNEILLLANQKVPTNKVWHPL